MEPQTHSNKKIAGVIVGIFGLITVITVTILGARKPADTSMQHITVDTTSIPSVPVEVLSQPTLVPTTAQPDIATNISPVVTNPQVPVVTVPTTPIDKPKPITPPVVASYAYKNGTYSATGSYMSPGGYDQLGVSVTLTNDIVTDVRVTLGANDRTSQRYQNIFAANYKQYVVGKDISTIHLTKVSGSSLTPAGFNNALSKIEAEAKA